MEEKTGQAAPARPTPTAQQHIASPASPIEPHDAQQQSFSILPVLPAIIESLAQKAQPRASSPPAIQGQLAKSRSAAEPAAAQMGQHPDFQADSIFFDGNGCLRAVPVL